MSSRGYPGHLERISLSRDGRVAEFQVTPKEEQLGETLLAMGFTPRSATFVRVFADSAVVPTIFESFAAHIEEMIRHKRDEVRAPWEAALELALQRVSGEVAFWLSGSAALAIRGIAVSPRDIDLVVGDALRGGDLFEDVLVEPVTRAEGWVADWFGRAFGGALIEWVSHVHAEVDNSGPHEQGQIAQSRLESVRWRGYEVPCTPLDLQLQVAEMRGLERLASAIRAFMRNVSA